MNKHELREFFIRQRKEMSDEERNRQSKSIVEQIQLDSRYQKAKVVALFYPMSKEVNLLPLLEDHKTFLFPRVDIDGIHFYPYSKPMAWRRSSFGVMEPEGDQSMDDQIDVMLAPALSVSKDLYRLGYGKGYYDHFLSNHRPKHVIGVIFHHEWMDVLPSTSYDQKLDDVIKGSL